MIDKEVDQMQHHVSVEEIVPTSSSKKTVGQKRKPHNPRKRKK